MVCAPSASQGGEAVGAPELRAQTVELYDPPEASLSLGEWEIAHVPSAIRVRAFTRECWKGQEIIEAALRSLGDPVEAI